MTSNIFPHGVSEILSSVFNTTDNSDLMQYFLEMIDTVDVGVKTMIDEDPTFLPLSEEMYTPHRMINATGLRELGKFLDKQDCADHYGGLVQCVDNDNEILWLCEDHRQGYNPLDAAKQVELGSIGFSQPSQPPSLSSFSNISYGPLDSPNTSTNSFGPNISNTSNIPTNSFGPSNTSTTPTNSFGPSNTSNTPTNSFGPSNISNTPNTSANSFGPSNTSNIPTNSFGPSNTSNIPTNSFGPSNISNTPANSFGPSNTPNTPTNSFGPSNTSNTPTNSFGSSNISNTPTNSFGPLSTLPLISIGSPESRSNGSNDIISRDPFASYPTLTSPFVTGNTLKWDYSKFYMESSTDPLDSYFALEYVCKILGEVVENVIESGRKHFRRDDIMEIAQKMRENLDGLNRNWYDSNQKVQFIRILKDQVHLYNRFLWLIVRYCAGKLFLFNRFGSKSASDS
ncbi:hypothetical protein C1645_550331 [Glomus cerebriforme]|uniref:Uncharacterized protein n=1 Tax=Glomus cerebriforme TaxID=658196 RepID=A0A397S9U2_9GLOM|nr:hypothetical protein C1645_550331 [Glomus cerebriforme]